MQKKYGSTSHIITFVLLFLLFASALLCNAGALEARVYTASTPDDGIEFNIQAVRRIVGEELKPEVLSKSDGVRITDGIVFRSEDSDIASVDSDGTITARSEGDTYIIAETAGGSTARCHIYVFEKAIAPVELIPKDIVTSKSDIVINCLGDSITTIAPAPEYGMNYHDWFARWYHVLNKDYGIGGATLTSAGYQPFVYRYQKMTDDADIVFVKGGTNDFANTSAPIGDYNSRALDTYRGALRNLMEGLIEKYPDKHIVFLSVIRRCDGIDYKSQNSSGSVLGDFAAATEALAREYGIDSLDIYNPEQLDFTGADAIKELMPDRLHPSGIGHKILANYIIEKLTEKGVVYVNDKAENEEVRITDYKLYKAHDLIRAANGTKLKVDNTLLRADNSEHVHIHAGDFNESVDNTQVIFSLDRLGNDWLLKDYPFVKVGYKTNVPMTNTWEAVVKRNGKYSRHWGMNIEFEKDGKPHDLVLDLPARMTGGMESGYGSFDDIDEDSRVNEFWFKPWGGQTLADMKADEYLDIEYIAFFKTAAEANAFKYSFVGDINDDGLADTRDVLEAFRAAAGMGRYSAESLDYICDLDGDEKFTARDAIIFARHLSAWRGYEKLPIFTNKTGADQDVYLPSDSD